MKEKLIDAHRVIGYSELSHTPTDRRINFLLEVLIDLADRLEKLEEKQK